MSASDWLIFGGIYLAALAIFIPVMWWIFKEAGR